MKNKKITQAVVSDQTEVDPSQVMEEIVLLNPDGSPYSGGNGGGNGGGSLFGGDAINVILMPNDAPPLNHEDYTKEPFIDDPLVFYFGGQSSNVPVGIYSISKNSITPLLLSTDNLDHTLIIVGVQRYDTWQDFKDLDVRYKSYIGFIPKHYSISGAISLTANMGTTE